MRIPQIGSRSRGRRGFAGRGRSIAVVTVLALVVAMVLLRAGARLYTDFLWHDALGVSDAWERLLGIQGLLSFGFAVGFFVFAYANLAFSDRIAPPVVPRRNGDEVVERYRELVGGRKRTVNLVSAIVFALFAGAGAASQWQNWVLFRFGGSFGQKDPLNNTDLGFYVFRLPFLSYVVSWAFAAVLIVLVLVAMNHYLNGAIHLPGVGAPATTAVKAHISVLLALLALIKGGDYFLDRYRLTMSNRGVVTGALYTDVNATWPATMLLVLVSLLCAAVFIANIRRRGWGLAAISIGIWMLMALIAGVAYPAAVQSLKVEAKESALESKFISRNIASTRQAFGIDDVKERDFNYQATLSDQAITDNASTVSNIRLLDPAVIPPTFTTLQSIRDYYRFSDLDVDRYQLDGEQTEVVIGARDLDQSSLPRQTWEAKHLSYTHGFGVAMAPANAVTRDGKPEFAIADIPVKIDRDQLPDLTLDQPEIYFGEGLDAADEKGYAIVGTSLKEEGEQYKGKGGVAINTFVRQAAFALRMGELEPLISDYVGDRSRVLFIRDIKQRASALTPFLHWDADPYPVLVDGRINYVLDGYTTSEAMPYSERYDGAGLDPASGLFGLPFNYVRNSVKAVVDAYDGSVDFYLTDDLYGSKDPIIRAYASAFPELFSPVSDMPPVIREHLRYPEDLFRVQTSMWGRYHLEDPGDFYKQEDGWDVAQNPPLDVRQNGTTATSGERIKPYYLQMKLPTERTDEFVIFRPFVPHTRPGSENPKKQLNAFMVGRSDSDQYGTLAVYTMTEEGPDGTTIRNTDVDGPLSVHERIVSSTGLSERLTQLNGQSGAAKVKLGNLLMVPIDEGLLYVRPIYVAGEAAGSAAQLRIVVVAVGDEVATGDTLAEAMKKLFPTAEIATRENANPPSTDPADPADPSDPVDDPDQNSDKDPAALIADALALFDEADEALRTGGVEALSEYQTKTAQAQELVRKAEKLLAADAP